MSTLNDKVRQAIEDLHLREPKIDVRGGPPAIFATVVSGSFSGVDEAERQRQVWDSLRRTLNEDERVAVEFVFTIAPDDPDVEAEE